MGSSQPPTLITTSFKQTNLISDGSVPALSTDPNLINPWGISYGSLGTGGEFWISDAGRGLTSIDVIASSGILVDLFPPVTIPSGRPGVRSSPTGQVYNGFLRTGAFTLPTGSAAVFLFATEDGTIAGWNIPDGLQARTVVNESDNPALGAFGLGAVYKGLAIGESSRGPALYAANFRHGTVDVFDGSFGYVTRFTDPNVRDGYAPFNVQVLDNRLFVTFALQDPAKQHDIAGASN